MIPASVAIDRAGLDLDPSAFPDASFERMGTLLAWVTGRSAGAITLGSRVFVAGELFDLVVAGARPDLVAHELVHVAQWKTEGPWFPIRYLGEYVRLRIVGLSHDAAYRSISYEIAAYDAENRIKGVVV
jgi:hypothetical protein